MAGDVRVKIDLSKVIESFADFKHDLQDELMLGFKQLAAQTNAKLKELAASKLGHGSRWDKFKDSLGFEQVDENVYVISISDKGLWVEEGLPKDFDMKPGLLKKGAKTSKAGYKYRVVPFEHSRPPRQTNDYGKNLIDRIKSELKDRQLPFKKLETFPNGVPKLGKLHSFSVPSEKPSSNASTDVLSKVTIYQTHNKKTNKVSRQIFTFRTVSNKPGQEDKWKHPGLDAEHFLEQVAEWASQHWENEILPSIIKKWE